jgi:hypothetical protein
MFAVTASVTVHVARAAGLVPGSVTLEPPAAAVTVPPVQVVTAFAAIVTFVGSTSVAPVPIARSPTRSRVRSSRSTSSRER